MPSRKSSISLALSFYSNGTPFLFLPSIFLLAGRRSGNKNSHLDTLELEGCYAGPLALKDMNRKEIRERGKQMWQVSWCPLAPRVRKPLKRHPYPILSCFPSHADEAQVYQLSWLVILLLYAGSQLSALAQSTCWSFLLLCSLISKPLYCRFLGMEESCGPVGRKLVGTGAYWVHICLAGRGKEKAAGSSAEPEVLVTHSSGGGSWRQQKGRGGHFSPF